MHSCISLSVASITIYNKVLGVHARDGEEYAARRTFDNIVHAWNRIFALSIAKLVALWSMHGHLERNESMVIV
jgi:hypothetical protein